MEREYQCKREAGAQVAQAHRVTSLLLDEGYPSSSVAISGASGASVGGAQLSSSTNSAAISGQQTSQLPSGDDLYDHGPDIVPKQEFCATPTTAIAPKPPSNSNSPFNRGNSVKSKRKRCDTWHGESEKADEKTFIILDPGIEKGLNTKRKFAR